MKRSIFRNYILAGVIGLSGISQNVEAKPKSIVAVEPLVCDVVSAIAPPSSPITCLINRKQDVHDVKISPRQAQTLNNASQIFTLGPEMTPAMKNWVDKPLTVVVGVSAIEIDEHHDDHDDHDDHLAIKDEDHHDHGDDVEPIAQVPDEGGDHHHHDHGGVDPHIWHDPHNIIKMGNVISQNIKKRISIFDQKNRKALSERSKSFESVLEDLDKWTQKQVSTIPSSQRTLVSKHKAMEYYGDAFGLRTISLLDFMGHSASLTPKTIRSVLAELREKNVKVIFPEQTPPSKILRNLSKQTSIPIASEQLFVDGLMPTGSTISVAVHNTCSIVNSLGGSCDKKTGIQLENRWESLIKR